MLDEGAIEGAQGIESNDLADVGHRIIAVKQITARLGNAQRIDIIIETHAKLSAEQMRNIVFVQMQLPYLKYLKNQYTI